MDCSPVIAMVAYNGLVCVFVSRFNTTFVSFLQADILDVRIKSSHLHHALTTTHRRSTLVSLLLRTA